MKEICKMNMEWFITDVIDDFKNLQAVAELFLDVFFELSYNKMDECHAIQYKQLCSRRGQLLSIRNKTAIFESLQGKERLNFLRWRFLGCARNTRLAAR